MDTAIELPRMSSGRPSKVVSLRAGLGMVLIDSRTDRGSIVTSTVLTKPTVPCAVRHTHVPLKGKERELGIREDGGKRERERVAGLEGKGEKRERE